MVILRGGGDNKSTEEVRKTLELISKNLASVLKTGEIGQSKGRRTR